jgi:hypothetical protein
VAAAPRWAGVLVITFAVSASVTAPVLETEVGQLALLDQLDRTASALGQPMDDAKYAALEEISENGATYAIVTSFVSGPLLALGLSGVLTGAFRTAVGGGATFRQVLAVVSHASVILAVRQVIAAPVVYARETLASPLTLSMFFSMLDEGSLLSRFAGSVDLFVIWWVAVLAVGMSVLYRLPASRLAVVFMGIYILLAVLFAGVLTLTGGAA